mmetsp:Transcript_27943/g.70713  ORF Transcript_27943/g.70713 Transcript_27943/m.70713 type:complete len:297 (+) Transcript_27943:627-1517(+)
MLRVVNLAPDLLEQRFAIRHVLGRDGGVVRAERDSRAHPGHQAVHLVLEEPEAVGRAQRLRCELLAQRCQHTLVRQSAEVVVLCLLHRWAHFGVHQHVLLGEVHRVHHNVRKRAHADVTVETREKRHAGLLRPRHIGAAEEDGLLDHLRICIHQRGRQDLLPVDVGLAQALAIPHLHVETLRDQLSHQAVARQRVAVREVYRTKGWGARVVGAAAYRVHQVGQVALKGALFVSALPAIIARRRHARTVSDEHLGLQQLGPGLRRCGHRAPVQVGVAVLPHNGLIVIARRARRYVGT